MHRFASIVALGMLAIGPASSRGEFLIDSHSVRIDPENDLARFDVLFTEAPDFATKDEDGRRATEFAFDIDTLGRYGPANDSFSMVDRVLRMPFRAGPDGVIELLPLVPPGRFGDPLAIAALEVAGAAVSFILPLAPLGGDGVFSYRLLALEYGLTGDVAWGRPNQGPGGGGTPAVPEPASLAMAGLGMLGAAGFLATRRTRR